MRAVGIGAGGHAKVVLEALQTRGDVEVVSPLDKDHDLKGSLVLGVRVLGGDELLTHLRQEGIQHAFMGVGGTGENAPRRRLFEMAEKSGFQLISAVQASAVISPSATIGQGTCLCPGAILAAGARLERNVIINTGAIVEHDCDVADHVHIASGAVLAGNVVVGEGAHVGASASVRQGVRIGRHVVVGMGAAVVEDVPDGCVVAGVPARLMSAAPRGGRGK